MKTGIIFLITLSAVVWGCNTGVEPKAQQMAVSIPDPAGLIPKDQPAIAKAEGPVHTRYEYTDVDGKAVIVENSYPKGGLKYTAPNGQIYVYGVFWTRITNETDFSTELKFDFPADSFEISAATNSYFKIRLPPDTLTDNKIPKFNYGLTDFDSIMDMETNVLNRTIPPGDAIGFYVLTLFNKGIEGVVRAGLSFEEKGMIYAVNEYKAPCGYFYNENLKLGTE